MSQNNHRLFTIGQFASLHQINKKTLMWYDETGLFRPAVVKENGYRYYTSVSYTHLDVYKRQPLSYRIIAVARSSTSKTSLPSAEDA